MLLQNYIQLFATIIQQEIKFPLEDVLTMIEIPPENISWDLAFPCFSVAKRLKKAPNLVAQEFAKKFSGEHFDHFEAVGGYLNAHIKKSDFIKEFFLAKPSTFNLQPSTSTKVLIEYMSANPNKPLHIGQARNICVGDSIQRMYKKLGYQVTTCDYGDDSGVNVGYNIVWHLYYDFPLTTEKKFDHYCGEIYEKMRKLDEDPLFKQRLSDILINIEAWTDQEIKSLHQKYTKDCTLAQFTTCRRMGAYFDLVVWETAILHLNFFTQAIDILKAQWWVTYADDGDAKWCWILDLSSLSEYAKEEKQYQILIKSDGVATYIAKDIAFAMWKLGYLGENFGYEKFTQDPMGTTVFTSISDTWTGATHDFGNYDTAITIIDNRQLLPQEIVHAALKLLGHTHGEKQYLPLGYGVVYLTPHTLMKLWYELSEEEKKEKRLPFSSRKGWTVTIDEMLDMLHKKAHFETKERNSEKSEERLDQVAESIAISALRFFLIRGDINKDIIFDIDEVMDMQGETWAYVLYTWARMQSIIDSAGTIDQKKINYSLLQADEEFALIKKISSFSAVVEKAAGDLAPHLIAKFCFELSQLVNNYYAHIKILIDDKAMKEARVTLLIKTMETLKEAMELIGMKFVERM